MGQNSVPPVHVPIPTKIGSKMGGEFTYQPKWDPISGDPQSPFWKHVAVAKWTLWVKNGYPFWNPNKWNQGLNLRSPAALTLTHTHVKPPHVFSSAGRPKRSKAPGRAMAGEPPQTTGQRLSRARLSHAQRYHVIEKESACDFCDPCRAKPPIPPQQKNRFKRWPCLPGPTQSANPSFHAAHFSRLAANFGCGV